MASFKSVPILDFSLSRSASTKAQFLEELKTALLEVGFLYIKNTGIDDELVKKVVELGKRFFELPEEEKSRIEMVNSPHFLGYSKLGNEITKQATDWREQIDLATELPAPDPNEPRYRKLRGPNMWPDEELLPGFRETYTSYITKMSALSEQFMSLVAEAIGLPPDSFDRFYTGSPSLSGTQRQDKLKIIKYPDVSSLPESATQGVGPHKDSMLSSFLLQASPHEGLQVQNSSGEWIQCPPIPGTLVVALGQGLEAITEGVVASTTHRVISPKGGEGPRFSIPFFMGVSYDATFETMGVPEEVKALKRAVREKEGKGGDVEFTFTKDRFSHLGEATLMNRVKSHPDVGQKYYPDLLARVRREEKEAAAKDGKKAEDSEGSLKAEDPKPKGRRRAPTIVVEKTAGDPSYGEDPGPNGSEERRLAYQMRMADAKPDEIRVLVEE